MRSTAARTGGRTAGRLHTGGGELALPTGPTEEHHQPLGDGLGDLAAVVLLDQGERQVDPGRDTGRAPGVAVADVDRVGVDHELGGAGGRAGGVRAQWVVTRQPGSNQPAAAPEQSTRTDRCPPPGSRAGPHQARQELGVVQRALHTVASRHDEGVDLVELVEAGGSPGA